MDEDTQKKAKKVHEHLQRVAELQMKLKSIGPEPEKLNDELSTLSGLLQVLCDLSNEILGWSQWLSGAYQEKAGKLMKSEQQMESYQLETQTLQEQLNQICSEHEKTIDKE